MQITVIFIVLFALAKRITATFAKNASDGAKK